MGRMRDALAVLTRKAPAKTGEASATYSRSRGYGGGPGTFDGSKMRDSLRRMYPTGFDLDAETLRARSRQAYWDSPIGRSAVRRLSDSTIGTGLRPRSAPAWELIKSSMSDEQKRALSDEIDIRFKLWAESHEPDATGRRNLSELLAFIFDNELRDGDIPLILRYSGDSSRVSPLNIQVLDADQIDTRQTTYGTPHNAGLALDAQSRGNVLKDGLELTNSGELVALYVLDPTKPFGTPTRIPAWGKPTPQNSRGRRFVLLPSILDLPGQVRGVGPLASIVHELQKITDYSAAELEAAIINAIFAAVIEPGAENDTRSKAKEVLGSGESASASADEPMAISKTGILVDRLKAGEKLASYNTARPNVNFGGFVDTIATFVSSALSIPYSVLKELFSANYSASRAEWNLFWQRILNWRAHVISQVLAPLYESWLREEVTAGKFPQLRANGFGTDPVMTRAWLQSDWIGDPMPSIDPLKDAQADDVRIAQGATTRERVALEYNGTDFYDNAKRLHAEKDALPEESVTVSASRLAVPGSDEETPPAKTPDKGGKK